MSTSSPSSGASFDRSAGASVSGLTVPSFALGGRFSSNVPGGCTGSYSSVASLPASCKIIFEPPGCEGRKSVTS